MGTEKQDEIVIRRLAEAQADIEMLEERLQAMEAAFHMLVQVLADDPNFPRERFERRLARVANEFESQDRSDVANELDLHRALLHDLLQPSDKKP